MLRGAEEAGEEVHYATDNFTPIALSLCALSRHILISQLCKSTSIVKIQNSDMTLLSFYYIPTDSFD